MPTICVEGVPDQDGPDVPVWMEYSTATGYHTHNTFRRHWGTKTESRAQIHQVKAKTVMGASLSGRKHCVAASPRAKTSTYRPHSTTQDLDPSHRHPDQTQATNVNISKPPSITLDRPLHNPAIHRQRLAGHRNLFPSYMSNTLHTQLPSRAHRTGYTVRELLK